MSATFIALDVETANPDYSSICAVGAARFEDGKVTETLDTLVDPQAFFDDWNVSIHGITPERVEGKPQMPEIAPEIERFVGSDLVVSHTSFDRVAVARAFERYGLTPPRWRWLDTARVSRRAWAQFAKSGYGLASVAAHCGIEFRHHEALEDARAAGGILVRAMAESETTLDEWIRRVNQPITEPTARSNVSLPGNPEGPLFGEVVVFTGALTMTRAEAAGTAASLGCQVCGAVSKKTTMLVVGQQDLSKLGGYEKSSKQRKAEALVSQGVPLAILSEDDFCHLTRDAAAP